MNIFGYGFRPFFFLSGVAALLLVAGWLHALLGGGAAGAGFDPLTWHAHEMLFGFVAAMIAGFLLTAVPNWTGEKARRGAPLAALAGLWIAARLLLLCTDSSLGAVVDLAFYPGLLALLLPPLLRKRQPKFFIFVPILAALWVANLLVHLQNWQLAPTGRLGTSLAVGLILLLITVIGGRIIPFFTRIAVGNEPVLSPTVTALSVVSVVCLPLVEILQPAASVVLAWAALATLSHGLRLWGWSSRKIWRIPLLWVLHTGYGWMVVGFALRGLVALDLVPPTAPLHAFTAGAMGVVGLGVMSRASLGHTGRPLVPSRLTSCSFVMVNLAALLRVGAPLLELPMGISYGLSGALWCGAFLMFLWVYTPILFGPRADGKPG